MLQLVRRAELAPGVWPFIASATGFSPPRNNPVAGGGGVSSASCPSTRRREAGEICRAPWKPDKGELRSPDKLKHVPRGRPNESFPRRPGPPRHFAHRSRVSTICTRCLKVCWCECPDQFNDPIAFCRKSSIARRYSIHCQSSLGWSFE
jgi:hypothetical protein